jgi:hypothetical protein
MTFYNVISGLLFLGAVRQLLVAADAGSLPQALMAGTFAILVFNDAVYTSHVVEGEGTVKYKLNLMLIDLVSFLLLALAMVTINPIDNVFNAPMPRLAEWLSEAWFWFFLALYWGSVMLWTHIAGLYRTRHPRSLVIASSFILTLFALEALLAASHVTWAMTGGRFLALGYLVTYIVLIRPRVLGRAKLAAA